MSNINFESVKRASSKWTKNDWQLVSMASLSIVFLAIFAYLPIFGIILAFKDGDGKLNVLRAMFQSDWVGLENFKEFLLDKDFINIMLNTIGLNLFQLAIVFPAPIIFALLLNEVYSQKFKKTVQTITYLPQFLSWVIFGGMVLTLLDLDSGIINDIAVKLHLVKAPVDFMGKPDYFWWIIVLSTLIKGVGWGSIIYLAAISGIDLELYEAATIDGSNRWHKARYITLPSIAPSIVLFLILNISSLLHSGVEQILVFQNQLNLSRSEVIDTFVLKFGIKNSMYSYATAIGLFKSIVSLMLLLSSNFLAKKLTGDGII